MWSRLQPWTKFFIFLVLVAGLAGLWKTFGPKSAPSTASTPSSGVLSKVANVFSSGPDITLGVNTWTGFAPVAWLNDGSLEPNKESILYKKYGIKLKIVILDAFTNSREAFKSNNINVVYCTTDALPVEMGASSGMVELKTEQFLQVDWSRGGDLIVVRKGINTVADLKGKTVAVAQGTASHTFLIKTLESNGLTTNDVTIKLVSDGIEAASLFNNKVVDAAVIWTPDDGTCLQTVSGSKVLVSTKSAAYVIADGLLARNEFITKDNDLLVKFGTAWLEANGELNSSSALREEAAVAFAKCFKGVDLAFAQNG